MKRLTKCSHGGRTRQALWLAAFALLPPAPLALDSALTLLRLRALAEQGQLRVLHAEPGRPAQKPRYFYQDASGTLHRANVPPSTYVVTMLPSRPAVHVPGCVSRDQVRRAARAAGHRILLALAASTLAAVVTLLLIRLPTGTALRRCGH